VSHAPISTEADIAQYLLQTPEFFERHAELLAQVRLHSPHGGRAVSLQERQLEQLRERLKQQEERYASLIHIGQDNARLAERMHRWTCAVMLARSAGLLGQVLIEKLRHEFAIPQVALRMWRVAPAYTHLPLAKPVSEDVRTFAASLTQPFCGRNANYEAATWMSDGTPVQSLAMVPLRLGRSSAECFGLLVMGSPDPQRYQANMAVDFLAQVGEVASAALGRLLAAQ
jgi:uncharacterized protein YigA (DUF484 family)